MGFVILSTSMIDSYMYIGANRITWNTKKQSTVSHSDVDAKYCSMASFIAGNLTGSSFLRSDLVYLSLALYTFVTMLVSTLQEKVALGSLITNQI